MSINPGWGSQWETLANAINSYYGGGIDSSQYKTVYNYLQSGNYTMDEMESILQQIPEFERTYSSDGTLIKVAYKENINNTTYSSATYNTATSSAQQINSNISGGTSSVTNTTTFKTMQNVVKDSNTGKSTITTELTKWRGGTQGTAEMIAGSVLSSVAAVGCGIALGKTIDSALYNLNPDFWDSNGMSSINPDTWASLTSEDDSLGASLINMLLDIDTTTGNPTAYIDENMLAYMTLYMAQQGALNETTIIEVSESELYTPNDIGNRVNAQYTNTYNDSGVYFTSTYPTYKLLIGSTRVCYVFPPDNTVNTTITFSNGTVNTITPSSYSSYTYNNITIYFFNVTNYASGMSPDYTLYSVNQDRGKYNVWNLGYILNYGNATIISDVDGISSQSGATQPNTITNEMTVAEVLAELQSLYPELWNEKVQYSTDGDNTYTYIPIGLPTGYTSIGATQPTSNGATQSDLTADVSSDGDNATDDLIDSLIQFFNQYSTNTSPSSDTPIDVTGDNTTNDNDTGSGTTPSIITPDGSASALYTIYNPTQSELNTFGSWLWSSNFVDQILKVFSDPMQAIIGLHKIYATPPTSGSGTIKVGYLTSTATANYVSGQYTSIDCGSVNLLEYFGNILDYDPYTTIRLYLPFIGIINLENSDVMRSTISIKYTVDVLTGACLANVTITRDLVGGVLYTYSGNCAVQYPISSGSYVGIVTGILGIAGGIAGTVLSGGALAPMLMGAGASIGAAHTRVEHSGNISGNAGAMGCKIPYIIIERPQTSIADAINVEGRANNLYTVLSSISGFFKVKKCRYDGISCTSTELNMIKNILEKGVYM